MWEVTNPRRPRPCARCQRHFWVVTDTLREFVAFTAAAFTPRSFGRVATQNLHALNLDGRLDLVIVTYPPFYQEAERLAAHRRSHDGLDVRTVVTTDAVLTSSARADRT